MPRRGGHERSAAISPRRFRSSVSSTAFRPFFDLSQNGRQLPSRLPFLPPPFKRYLTSTKGLSSLLSRRRRVTLVPIWALEAAVYVSRFDCHKALYKELLFQLASRPRDLENDQGKQSLERSSWPTRRSLCGLFRPSRPSRSSTLMLTPSVQPRRTVPIGNAGPCRPGSGLRRGAGFGPAGNSREAAFYAIRDASGSTLSYVAAVSTPQLSDVNRCISRCTGHRSRHMTRCGSGFPRRVRFGS
jgi:hypothetical protein